MDRICIFGGCLLVVIDLCKPEESLNSNRNSQCEKCISGGRLGSNNNSNGRLGSSNSSGGGGGSERSFIRNW